QLPLLQGALLHDARAAAPELGRPPHRAVPGPTELALPLAMRLEPFACAGRRQRLRRVLREPRPDLFPEGLLLGRVGEIHASYSWCNASRTTSSRWKLSATLVGSPRK